VFGLGVPLTLVLLIGGSSARLFAKREFDAVSQRQHTFFIR